MSAKTFKCIVCDEFLHRRDFGDFREKICQQCCEGGSDNDSLPLLELTPTGKGKGKDKGKGKGQQKGSGAGQDKGQAKGTGKGTDKGQQKGSDKGQGKGTDTASFMASRWRTEPY